MAGVHRRAGALRLEKPRPAQPQTEQAQARNGKATGRGGDGKRYWPCPLCGDLLDATPRPGGGIWLGCNKCREHDGLTGGPWLSAIAEAETGDPKQAANLLAYPESVLGPPTTQHATNGEPAPLPPGKWLCKVQEQLWAEDEAVAWLEGRGLNERTVRRAGIGWNGDFGDGEFVIPIYDARRRLANIITRPLHVPRGGKKYVGKRGHKAQLYPRPLPKGSWLLCEGLFDALLARQHGLPAVTSSHGKSFPERRLPLVNGRRIAVVYDCDAEDAACSRVDQLNTARAEAWVVRLSKLGDLPPKGDLTDYLVGGGAARDIRDLANREYLENRAHG